MLRRISLLAAALVVMVLALQLRTRTEPALAPPEQPPAVDPASDPALPLPEPSNSERPEEVARLDAAPAATPRRFERRFMFDCNGDSFFVRIGDDQASLLPPGSLTGYYIPLARVGSAWRGRYANENITFRYDGDVGAFELGEHTFENCVATRDRASMVEANAGPVTVQAFGHAPAWNFEIVAPEGFVLTARGERHVVPFREPIDSGGKITFRSVVGTQEMVVVIDRVPCRDAPSGETFEHTATVTFDGAWYYGCGRFVRYTDQPPVSR